MLIADKIDYPGCCSYSFVYMMQLQTNLDQSCGSALI